MTSLFVPVRKFAAVGVIGSGVSGLTAAYYALKKDMAVTLACSI